MTIALRPATTEDRAALDALGELYAYDFSELTGDNVGDDGRFGGDFFRRCFGANPTQRAYVVRVDDKLAGFAVVGFQSRFHDDPAIVDVAQFFIVRSLRRRGVGRSVATQLFDLFRGRPIEVREMIGNVAAQAFWRTAIDRYTGGDFDETLYDDARWRGPVQSFVVT